MNSAISLPLSAFYRVAPFPSLGQVGQILMHPLSLIAFAAIAFVLMIVLYKKWTHPPVALGLLIFIAGGFFASLTRPHVRAMVATPDHVAVVILIFAAMGFVWFVMRRAAINDAREMMGLPPLDRGTRLIGPDLQHAELICLIIALAGVVALAILFPAAIDRPANPSRVPATNISWYLLGARLMLNDLDPWLLLGVYPAAMFIGLLALPWLDDNAKGDGHYTLRSRPFATIATLFFFLMFIVLPICIGAFASITAPKAPTAHTTGHDCLFRPLPGLAILLAYFILIPLALRFSLLRRWHARLGSRRYALLMLLLLLLALIPIKLLLHDLTGMKYLISLPRWNMNI